MHLSPVKGGFPFKDQHDRTAMAKYGTDIERGTVIRINAQGEFEPAADASVYPMYLALQRYTDLQAIMAGLFTPANGDPGLGKDNANKFNYGPFPKAADFGSGTKTRPAISGIHMDDGDVWETDMYDTEAPSDTWTMNALLTVVNGRITPVGATKENCVGFLVKAPYTRWANDAVAVEGMMTGKNIDVIQFQCGK